MILIFRPYSRASRSKGLNQCSFASLRCSLMIEDLDRVRHSSLATTSLVAHVQECTCMLQESHRDQSQTKIALGAWFAVFVPRRHEVLKESGNSKGCRMRVDAGEDPLPCSESTPTEPRDAISSSSCSLRQGRLHLIGHPETESELRLRDQRFRSNFR